MMKTQKEMPNIEPMKWKVSFQSVGQICGGRPQTEVSQTYLEDLFGTLGEKFGALTDVERTDQMKIWKKKMITVFRRMPDGQLAFGADQLKAAIKEIANVGGVGLKQHFQHGVWVEGVSVNGLHYLPIFREDKPLKKPDGYYETEIPPTFMNPRACIKASEAIYPVITFDAMVTTISPKLKVGLPNLLAKVNNLGSARAHGYGMVTCTKVEAI